jgi:membrane protein insertase Oxa1/YidC/SpoIIIJ
LSNSQVSRYLAFTCLTCSRDRACPQALAPKAKELKAKYGRNKALLNQLTAKLYEDANVNPLAGCLPALAQVGGTTLKK